MWSFFRYGIICAVFGRLVSSTAAAGLFGSLLGENDSNNNSPKSSNIPLIGALGIGSNTDEQNRLNNDNYQYTNNKKYTDNNNNARGLFSILGGNTNVNKPNENTFNNLNRYPNIANNKPANNANDLKNQVKDAEKLLEKLKELNRLKEQQKLEKDDEKDSENIDNSGNGNDKPKSDNNSANSYDDSQTIMKGGLKSLTKKKFYFIVKPVVPENEAGKYDQTVYYVD